MVDSFGESHVYPDLSSRQMEVTAEYINSIVGVQLDAPTAASLLSKMQLRAVGGWGLWRWALGGLCWGWGWAQVLRLCMWQG